MLSIHPEIIESLQVWLQLVCAVDHVTISRMSFERLQLESFKFILLSHSLSVSHCWLVQNNFCHSSRLTAWPLLQLPHRFADF